MIYHISLYLKPCISALNVVHYVSFRAMAALLSTLLLSFLFGTWFISKSKLFFRAKRRAWTPHTHEQKDNMPTMGGIFILTVVLISIFFWCDLTRPSTWIFLICLIGFGAIGFWDDWQKINRGYGISSLHKFVFQCLVALIVISLLLFVHGTTTILSFPFFKTLNFDLGWLFILWAMFILVACSNGVNLTDGLDGLAIGSLIPNFITFSLLCYVAGNCKIASYLHIPFAGSSEITIIGATLIGASLGFLWYNAYPAQIFMGDVGSLALGSGLALMAILAKQELLLVISGGLFVLEVISVIVQVISYKFFGRRVFKMAPIHHHFELLGWQESKITVRFIIISVILCLLALITLKIR